MTDRGAGTGTPAEDQFREWDAAYVLGALGPSDRRAFEVHLRACDACRSAVGEIAGIPALLRTVPASEAVTLGGGVDVAGNVDGGSGPSGVAIDGGTGAAGIGATGTDRAVTARTGTDTGVVILRRAAGAVRRHRRRWQTAVASVAACLLLVIGVMGVLLVRAQSPAPAEAAATHLVLEPVGQVDVSADVTLSAHPWGTRFDWSCTYPEAEWDGEPPVYELAVVDRDGRTTVVATWAGGDSPATGLVASSRVDAGDIDRVEIRLQGNGTPLAAART